MSKATIKRAVITGKNEDDKARPVQSVEYFGRNTKAEIVFPYGVHANLPEDSLMVILPVLGQSSNLVAFGGMPDQRIQVEQGEVVFFHPKTKAKIHFKNDGTIEIECSEMTIKGDLTVDGQVTSNGIKLDGHIHSNIVDVDVPDSGTYKSSVLVTGKSGVSE